MPNDLEGVTMSFLESIGGRKWTGFLILIGVSSAALFAGKMADLVWVGFATAVFAAFVAGNVSESKAEMRFLNPPTTPPVA